MRRHTLKKKPEDGAKVAPPSGLELMQLLTEQELRILGLIALGWTEPKIYKRAFVSEATLRKRTANIKLKMGLPTNASKDLMALRYVMELLEHDRLPDYEPGEKFEVWRTRARRRRAEMRRAGVLVPRHVELAMLLPNPEYVDLDAAALGQLMSGQKLGPTTVHGYLAALTGALPNGSRRKLMVVTCLAPLDYSDGTGDPPAGN